DARAPDFLGAALTVGDLPVTRQKLHRVGTLVLDGNRVGPQVMALAGIGLIREEGRLHLNADPAGHALVHDAKYGRSGSLDSSAGNHRRLTPLRPVARPSRWWSPSWR